MKLSQVLSINTVSILDYLAVRIAPDAYQVLKSHSSDSFGIDAGDVVDGAMNAHLINLCTSGHMVLDAKACGIELNDKGRIEW